MNELTKIKDTHYKYKEFELWQFKERIAKGETITIEFKGQKIRYTAKYDNCHLNTIIQDKGEQKNMGELLGN